MNNVPSALKTRPQWVTWNYLNGTKVPFNAQTGKHASSTNPKTWTSFDEAERARTERHHAGVGFVFSSDDPFTGIDLDDCIDDSGTIAPWAYAIVQALNSYTEISPSGQGLKIWVEGTIPTSVKTAQIEMYSERRYFAVTGRHLPGTPIAIRVSQAELTALYERVNTRQRKTEEHPYTTPALDDSYLRAWADRVIDSAVARMREARAGTRHNTRLAMGRLLGGLIKHGLMTEDRAERLLYDANAPETNQAAERQAIKDGIVNGKTDTLPLPPAPPQPAMDEEGFACCPDHRRRLTKGRRRGWYCSERDASTPSGWCNFWWAGDDYSEPQTTTQKEVPKTTETKSTRVDRHEWSETGITLSELQYKTFTPEKWVIEGILPEGACLLAAKYKSKKSWLALAVGMAVAMGGKALGRLEVSPGRVLYLDLEGKQQRIQKRTRAMLGVHQVNWPDNFHVFTKWPQGDEGMEWLARWFTVHPDTVYVVIDVLADFRRPIDKYEQPYQYDRATVAPINQLCEQYHATGLLVHHFNKAKNDDIMDGISGTTGLPSAVNTMWGLSRDPNDSRITILHLRGRDLENEDPIALRWDSYLNQHVVEGPANEVAISVERKAILKLLGDDEPRTPKEIAEGLSRPVATVQQLLRKLLNDGVIDKPVYGKYAIVRKADQTDQTDQSGNSYQSGKSDRDTSTLIGIQRGDQSGAAHQNAVNGNSDRSDRDSYRQFSNGVPTDYVPSAASREMIERLRRQSDEKYPR